MSNRQRNRGAGVVVGPIDDAVAAEITGLRLEEETKSNYRGKIKRVQLFLAEKNINALDDERTLRVPMHKGGYRMYS